MEGRAIQSGGDIENNFNNYKSILEKVNNSALLKDFISDAYQFLTNLWDPEKDNELKEYLKTNSSNDIQQYFIINNGKYYFSDVKFTQIMIGQLNSKYFPDIITKKNLNRHYAP